MTWSRKTRGAARAATVAVITLTASVVAVPSSSAATDGAGYSWGRNSAGQLGDGTTSTQLTPVAVVGMVGSTSSPLTFAQVDAGKEHVCGVDTAGVAYCWGKNVDGQLGDGSTTSYSQPVTVASYPAGTFASVSAGRDHSCGVTSANEMWCWGGNAYGQLGNGTTTASVTPVRVSASIPDHDWVAVSAGQYFTCGVTVGSAVYCWGRNDKGQLGDGSTTNRTVPVATVGPSGGSALAFTTISAGVQHVCGVSAGQGYCWGSQQYGRLGNGVDSSTPVTSPVAVSAPTGGSTLTFTSMATGAYHSCGVTSTGEAYCWGYNGDLVLGDGTGTQSEVPVQVVTPVGSPDVAFTAITASDYHSCALTTDGAAWCWGDNTSGQLGDGTTTASSTRVAVQGGGTYASVSAGYNLTAAITGSVAASSDSAAAPQGTAVFRFTLPDGQECTNISPVVVPRLTSYTLPASDADCRTSAGSSIVGWTIPWSDTVFPPQKRVWVVDSQTFTAVLREPDLTVIYDANVNPQDSCLAGGEPVALADRQVAVTLSRSGAADTLVARVSPCTPPGHELAGWSTSGDDHTDVTDGGTRLRESWVEGDANDIRLYAVWDVL